MVVGGTFFPFVGGVKISYRSETPKGYPTGNLLFAVLCFRRVLSAVLCRVLGIQGADNAIR